MRRGIIGLALLLVVPAGGLCAQRLSPPTFTELSLSHAVPDSGSAAVAVGQTAVRQSSVARLAVGGILGGATGAFTGAIIGAKAADTCEDCALIGAVYGFVAGGSVGLPLGVHLADRRRGSYGLSLLASLAIGAAGYGTTLAAHDDGRILIAVPIAQLVSSILIERATSRRARAAMPRDQTDLTRRGAGRN